MTEHTDKGHPLFAAFYEALGIRAERGGMGRRRTRSLAGTTGSVLKVGGGR